MDILKEFPDDIMEIDINYKKIEGILDFGRFTKLTKLNCNNNQITSLDTQEILSSDNISGAHYKFTYSKFIGCNLPNSLIKLNCNNNQITRLDNLSNSLNVLHCINNNIIGFDNLPSSLKKFFCDSAVKDYDKLMEKYNKN